MSNNHHNNQFSVLTSNLLIFFQSTKKSEENCSFVKFMKKDLSQFFKLLLAAVKKLYANKNEFMTDAVL